jgi:hypothetical protein
MIINTASSSNQPTFWLTRRNIDVYEIYQIVIAKRRSDLGEANEQNFEAAS